MFLRFATVAIALAVTGVVHAGDNQMTALDKQQFATFESQVKGEFEHGTRYSEISPANQQTVLKTLATMEDRWQKTDGNGNLSVSDTVAMANDQEVVTTILNHAAADSRRVCDREVPMGSKIAVNVCRTIAQMKRDQDSAQDELRNMQGTNPINHNPGGG